MSIHVITLFNKLFDEISCSNPLYSTVLYDVIIVVLSASVSLVSHITSLTSFSIVIILSCALNV